MPSSSGTLALNTAATTSANGLMSSSDKTKLNQFSTTSGKTYTMPSDSATIPSNDVATSSTDGLMSSTDKAYIDGLQNATKTVPAADYASIAERANKAVACTDGTNTKNIYDSLTALETNSLQYIDTLSDTTIYIKDLKAGVYNLVTTSSLAVVYIYYTPENVDTPSNFSFMLMPTTSGVLYI
jgi:hypothetical protein